MSSRRSKNCLPAPARAWKPWAAIHAPEPLTFDATLMELDSMTESLDYAMGVVRHLESVATYPELRAAYNAAQPEVSAFLYRHPAARRPLERRSRRTPPPRRPRLDGHAQAIPHQDRGQLPPPRRGPGCRRQSAPGSDRRGTGEAHYEVFGKCSGLDQRLRAGADRREATGRTAALRRRCRAPERRGQETARAGASRCRARATWR